jgi:DNA polymerase elongation subunit (family B)
VRPKTTIEMERARLLKTARSSIRLDWSLEAEPLLYRGMDKRERLGIRREHSLKADAEINRVVPELLVEFEAGVMAGELWSLREDLTFEFVRYLRVLDFDVETIAAGFADPEWVPQKITCVAWSWIGSDDVSVLTCGGSAGLYERPEKRRRMLDRFRRVLARADIVTGHNLLRFDLPVLNAEYMRLGLEPLQSVHVQDTMRIKRSKGFKKGQDNLAGLVQTFERKQAMDWQQWEDAYAEPGWPLVKSRAVSDVVMHKQLREQMIDRGWLRPMVRWYP